MLCSKNKRRVFLSLKKHGDHEAYLCYMSDRRMVAILHQFGFNFGRGAQNLIALGVATQRFIIIFY